jgi:anaphase-promoting complex subunit 3
MLILGACRYGLGTCYLRKCKIRMAEYHYRMAAEIHPNNAVLLGCVGMVCLNAERTSWGLTEMFARP